MEREREGGGCLDRSTTGLATLTPAHLLHSSLGSVTRNEEHRNAGKVNFKNASKQDSIALGRLLITDSSCQL